MTPNVWSLYGLEILVFIVHFYTIYVRLRHKSYIILNIVRQKS